MHHAIALALLLLTAPAAGQDAATSPATPAGHVRVTAHIIVVDRDAFTRAGLAWVALGNDRVQVSAGSRRPARSARVRIGTHGVSAFLEAVRESRWVRSESTQQVLAMSGAEALISSTDLSVGRRSARTRGPSLLVRPTILPDGRVHLDVSARVEDSVTSPWGYSVDGSPALVRTELIARAGEEVIIASSSAVQSTRGSGILGWDSGEQGRDVLIAVTAHVSP